MSSAGESAHREQRSRDVFPSNQDAAGNGSAWWWSADAVGHGYATGGNAESSSRRGSDADEIALAPRVPQRKC
jgi:hypothetical protein